MNINEKNNSVNVINIIISNDNNIKIIEEETTSYRKITIISIPDIISFSYTEPINKNGEYIFYNMEIITGVEDYSFLIKYSKEVENVITKLESLIGKIKL